MIACNCCGGNNSVLLIEKSGFEVVRCRSCHLIYVKNPPTDEQRSRLYSFDAGYHTDLHREETSRAFHERESIANLKILLKHVSSGSLLDIGCSTGLFLKAAREIGWSGEGLEYSQDTARIAREENGICVTAGELKSSTFAINSFDVVTMWDVLEHVSDPLHTLRLIRDIITPTGWLIVKTPDADGLFPSLSLKLAKLLGYWGHAEPPGHLYQFSTQTLGSMVELAGFEVVARHSRRIPLTYSFGPVRTWVRSVKWAAYCAFFLPIAWLAPYLGVGDDVVLVCRGRREPAQQGTRL